MRVFLGLFVMVFFILANLFGCAAPTTRQDEIKAQVVRNPSNSIDPATGVEATLEKLDETSTDESGQYVHDHSEKDGNLIAFKSLMTPAAGVADEKEKNKILMNGFRSYFDRNFTSYYIGFGMVKAFDRKLNELLLLKKQNKPFDTNEIQEFILKLNITRAFYERNQHRLADLYENLLNAGNDPSHEFHNTAKMALSSLQGILKSYKQEGHGLAVMSLAYLLDEVNRDYKEHHPDVKVLTYFKKYFVKDPAAIAKLEIQASARLADSKSHLINSFLQQLLEELPQKHHRSLRCHLPAVIFDHNSERTAPVPASMRVPKLFSQFPLFSRLNMY